MSTSLTFPMSRIEGHAQVVIEIQEGEVISARFQALEYRGFDYLVKGVDAEQITVIVPRICGVCSTAHHLASVKALEDAYGVTPPPLGQTIRELLMLGQTVQNQATSLFIFTMPDRLGVDSIFEMGDPDTVANGPNIASRALRVRQAGTDLIRLAGGQFIHPIKAIVGGVTSGVAPRDAEVVRNTVLQALPVARELFDIYWEMSLTMGERLGTWGDDNPACYITSLTEEQPDYTGDALRVMCADGSESVSFSAKDFQVYLDYEESGYSYSDKTTYGGQVMRANSLARINMTEQMGTPIADAYLDRFREAFGWPAHALMLFDLARGIELVYSLERAAEILTEPLNNGEVAVPHTPRDGEGYGLVEAPRGPLIHHYRIVDGAIEDVDFIIPTVHNMSAIERALRIAAERYIRQDQIDLELERAVGRVVRAFDPCIACATH
jgi:F420-non-reducing hydrogenase large subunit